MYKRQCLGLAAESFRRGGNAACVINAANEIANEAFRQGRIGFTDIYRVIEATLDSVDHTDSPTYDDFVASNSAARRVAAEFIASKL